MNKKQITKIAMLVVSLGVIPAHAAHAASPATATFQVLLTIQKTCSVTAGSGSNINLGTVAATAVNTSGTNSLSVNCSKSTPYFIGMLPSNANTAGAGAMAGTAVPANTVPYQLYSNAGLTTAWGNTATSTSVGNGVAGTGTGAAQTIPVWANVPSANYAPDSYVDTVTVNVNF